MRSHWTVALVLVATGCDRSTGAALPSGSADTDTDTATLHDTAPPTPKRRWSQVSVGSAFGCALDETGVVACFGEVPATEYELEALPPVAKVVVGEHHVCVLTVEGRVKCLGAVTEAPEGAGWTQVAAGLYHACALDAAGVGECWGGGPYGKDPPDGTTWRDIATYDGTCGLSKDDGSVHCWGEWAPDIDLAAVPDGPFVSVVTSIVFACALDAHGEPACWGRYMDGDVPVPVPGPYVALVEGEHHQCGLRADGSLSCWGYSFNLGWNEPPEGVAFVQADSAVAYSCGITKDAELLCWGRDEKDWPLPPPDL